MDTSLGVDKPCVDREGRRCWNIFCSHLHIFMRYGAYWFPPDALSIFSSGFSRYVNSLQVLGNFYLMNIVHFLFAVNCDLIIEVSINHKVVVPLIWGTSQLFQMLMVVPGMSCFPSREWHHLLWKKCSCWGREDELPPFLMVSERLAGLMWSFVGLWLKDCVVLIGSTNSKVSCFL